MHNTTYHRLRAERDELAKEVKRLNRPVPNSQLLSTRVWTEWRCEEPYESPERNN